MSNGLRPYEKEPLRRLNVNLPEGLLETVKQRAEIQGVSLAMLVRLALHQYLDRADENPKLVQTQSDFLRAIDHVSTAAVALSALAELAKKG